MQKIKLPLLAAGILAIALVVYFFLIRSFSALEAVPQSAVAVIECNDWNKLGDKLNTTATGSELKKTYAAQKLLQELTRMQQLLGNNQTLKDAIGSRNTVVSMHLASASNFAYLFVAEISGVNDNTLLNQIQKAPGVSSVRVHIFRNQKIVDVVLKDGGQLSFAKRRNILAFSFSSFLTETAVTALITGEGIDEDDNFDEVKAGVNPKNDLNVYFNFQKAHVLSPVAVKSDKNALLSDVKNTGSWGRFQVNLGNNKLELEGEVATESKEKPGETVSLLSENLLSKIADHATYVCLTNTGKESEETLKQYFENWLGNTKAFVIFEPLKENFTDQNVFVVGVKSQSTAIESLKKLASANGTLATAIDTVGSSAIFALGDGSVINRYFGNNLVTFERCVFTVTNNTAIFANNPDVLKLLLEKIGKGETLDKDKNFQNTGYAQMGRNSSIQYIDFSRGDLLVNGMLKEESSLRPFMSAFKSALVVTNEEKGKTSMRISLNASSENVASSGLLWKTKLQALSVYPPQMVLNSNTGENEIFAQDTANNIYLISQSGEILLTKNIDEPILGKVHQVDYYNNGKLQYIFNSAHKVFVIDRLGYDVAAYPLRLSATATAGMSVAKGRYYISCSNNSIYGYETNGRPLSGWSPRGGTGLISMPLQCFSQGKTDLLLAFNNAGRLMLFDAKGGLKWSVDNLPATRQNFQVVQWGNTFTLLDAAGNQLTEISADGNDDISPLIDSAATFCAIATADTGYTYYFSTGAQIRAYNNKTGFKTGVSTKAGNVTSMEILELGDFVYLLAKDESGQLFLYDTSLVQIATLSYPGAGAMAIGKLFNRKEPVVLTTDNAGNISCYRFR